MVRQKENKKIVPLLSSVLLAKGYAYLVEEIETTLTLDVSKFNSEVSEIHIKPNTLKPSSFIDIVMIDIYGKGTKLYYNLDKGTIEGSFIDSFLEGLFTCISSIVPSKRGEVTSVKFEGKKRAKTIMPLDLYSQTYKENKVTEYLKKVIDLYKVHLSSLRMVELASEPEVSTYIAMIPFVTPNGYLPVLNRYMFCGVVHTDKTFDYRKTVNEYPNNLLMPIEKDIRIDVKDWIVYGK